MTGRRYLPTPLLRWRRTADDVREVQRAAKLLLRSPSGAILLADLAQFCRAGQTTFHLDPRVHAALEGRREVFLRLVQLMELSEEELFDLWGGKYPDQPKE